MFTTTIADTTSLVRLLRQALRQIKPCLPENFDAEDDFKEDWGIDSQDLVKYVAHIEQHFMITVPDEDLKQIVSIQAVLNYLFSKTEGADA
ncbi:acyl carrier protein [Lewinella sp. LCG006]|uniref:acyl carrier protein n=1 Tax=Lewinella sp. LCG006 TaxID=3231911 RepID=UPI0034609691